MMGFSEMLPGYRKLLDKAVCTVESPAGNLQEPEKAAEYIWQKMGLRRKRRGYSYNHVLRIVQEQAAVPDGKRIGPTITIWL